MDVVEIFLICVVASSVLVFLILDHLDSVQNRSKCCVPGEIESEIGKEVTAGHGDFQKFDEKTVVAEKVEEEEEAVKRGDSTENRGGCAKLGFRSEEEGEIGDDWEGIESTELEQIFGKAMAFVNCNSNGDHRLSSAMDMDLYALQQVALQGPCHGSQPMALNLNARSKWKAWQRLGDMSREGAMEKYIETLSEAIPQWKEEVGEAASARAFGGVS
ncbi:acyl-CoA-binding domain-containing protein 1-like [Andrographis paniculata]|uniref:acyl-CoA-binding domain-containing protein 1-like n=1 Tax=Andrographis paniculata TaxID=175694 RepID=UPI0021E768DE|nr:acyl-CoA-binding domain-containing protein 1-like [Andrographis paniculata]XP_051117986.1 acyl-CoA-binding domain-containing protein 1-like [Andrographis paniculata]XP_051117987.1 acyl-CoA-binding domain-containing protein 1-like [Andrographis paniculata]XP_051117988.1 acyl-CoA-binding domain-containing protein 1-like [Andrographis paniculata]